MLETRSRETWPAALLFDLDGTLVDSEYLHYESTAAVLSMHGIALTREQYDVYVGWAERDCWTHLNARFDLDLEPDAAVRARTRIYAERLRGRPLPALPGARALLEWAYERRVPMAVASSLPREQIDVSLEAAGLDAYVRIRRSGHDDVPAGRGKPEPDVYLAAAEALGVDPLACVAFEDSPTGMRSARAAGCHVVGVPCPSHPTRDFSAADRVCASLADALDWLRTEATT